MAMRYEICNPCFDVTIIREKEEELEREKNLRKDLEQRYKVNMSNGAKGMASHKVVICTAVNAACAARFKALVNEDTLLRTHCCPWCFLGCANWETFVADTKCFWTKSETFFVSRSQNLCPQQMLRAQANEEAFMSATMCQQQCVFVCQGL